MHKRIAILGPESTGKSTLSEDLASTLGESRWVPEYAREYLEKIGPDYVEADLLQIAKGQLSLEDHIGSQVKKYLIIDTTLTVIRVWSEHKYGNCNPWIIQKEKSTMYDLLLVCDIDLPWEEDPLREHPHLRQHFFDIYKQYAETHPPYQIIRGNREQRLAIALEAAELV